jgi:hypothetical protein
MWQRPLLVLTVLLASVQLSVPFSLAPSAGHASLSTRSAASPFCHPITRAAAKLALRASPEPAAAMGTGSAAGGKKVKGILFDIDGLRSHHLRCCQPPAFRLHGSKLTSACRRHPVRLGPGAL